MRFLIDECLSVRGLLGATDEVVLAAALTESRIVVSADTDFGDLLAARRLAEPSLVLFRRHGRTAERQASMLLANLDQVASDLIAGAVVVIAGDRLPLRRLPIRWPGDSGD